jgi:hypothetical protein
MNTGAMNNGEICHGEVFDRAVRGTSAVFVDFFERVDGDEW